MTDSPSLWQLKKEASLRKSNALCERAGHFHFLDRRYQLLLPCRQPSPALDKEFWFHKSKWSHQAPSVSQLLFWKHQTRDRHAGKSPWSSRTQYVHRSVEIPPRDLHMSHSEIRI